MNLHPLDPQNAQFMCRLIHTQTEQLLWSDSYQIDKNASLYQQQVICGKIISTILDLQQGIVHTHWARKLLSNPDAIPDAYKVLAYYRHHADNFTSDSFQMAVAACKNILQHNPEDLIANVVYADYCRREHVYGYNVIKNPLETGKNCAEISARLKPNSHETHYVLGQILFNLGEKELSILEFKAARIISKHHVLVTFGMGYHLCVMNKWHEGMHLVREAMESNPIFPDWYHIAPFLNEYRQGHYAKALFSAKRIITPGIYWGPLARAACYGQLGQQDKAQNELKELLNRFPEFILTNKGIVLLKRFLGYDELTQQVWDGLLKAGIKERA